MSTAPAVRRPSALRRWSIRFLLLTAIGVIVVGSFAGWQLYRRSQDERKLRETIADLDARHPRWRLEYLEADRAVVPDAENSANVIRAAAAHIRPIVPQYPTDWADLRTNPCKPGTTLTDEQLRSVIDLLESIERAIAPTLSLERFPRGRHPITYSADVVSTRRPHFDDISKIQFRVLNPLLHLHLHERDGDAAVRDCVCMLHLGWSFGDEPVFFQVYRNTIVSYAARGMERVLSQLEVSDADLGRVQTKLEEEVAYDSWPTFLRGQLVGVNGMMEGLRAGAIKLSTIVPRSGIVGAQPSVLDNAKVWISDRYPPRIAETHAWVLSRTARLLDETLALPWHERSGALQAVYRDADSASPLARRWDLHEILNLFQSHQAVVRCTLVAVAAERYRLRHGRWPAAVANLVPAFLSQIPADPYDGQPLRYKRLPDGVVIYSVGPDGEDNGGVFSPPSVELTDTDIGVQLWDVDRRQQLPPPEEKQP